jgi:LysR family transcriptional regulator, low CO2-responsive transcriptional regulator
MGRNSDKDVAVLAHIDDDERLLTIPYRRHRIVALVRTDHRLARRRSIPLYELHGERLIVREIGSTTRRAFEAATRAHSVEPGIVMEIGSREAIREAVIRGLGISYVSEAEFIPDPSLVAVPISDAEIYTYAHVTVLAERRNSRLIAAFLGIVRATLEEEAGSDASPARGAKNSSRSHAPG